MFFAMRFFTEIVVFADFSYIVILPNSFCNLNSVHLICLTINGMQLYIIYINIFAYWLRIYTGTRAYVHASCTLAMDSMYGIMVLFFCRPYVCSTVQGLLGIPWTEICLFLCSAPWSGCRVKWRSGGQLVLIVDLRFFVLILPLHIIEQIFWRVMVGKALSGHDFAVSKCMTYYIFCHHHL